MSAPDLDQRRVEAPFDRRGQSVPAGGRPIAIGLFPTRRPQQHRRAAIDFQDQLLDVGDAFEIPAAAHHELEFQSATQSARAMPTWAAARCLEAFGLGPLLTMSAIELIAAHARPAIAGDLSAAAR